MMESNYDPTGSAPWVKAWKEGADYKFMVDVRGRDCYHTVTAPQFDAFITAIGQADGTPIDVAIGNALSTNVQSVVDAVHSELSSADFSWMSMSDIESITG
jgi:hypothetical protein